MESHEVLKSAVKQAGVKSIASEMGLSASLIYKWCEPSEGHHAGGTNNPLDRVVSLCRSTGTIEPVAWLCSQVGGFLVENPKPTLNNSVSLLNATKRILTAFSEMLEAITDSVNNDNLVDPEEARRIRSEWEDLKRAGEGFVLACEAELFGEK